MGSRLDEWMRDLARAEAWPSEPGEVAVVQTHISLVFVARDRVVKLKKPVDLGFLDFSTRELRLAACRAECRLNARLAPGIYEGVAAVARGSDGRWRVEEREPLADAPDEEPAVLMRRLPEERSLAGLLRDGLLDEAILQRVARRLAAFHDAADAGPAVREASRWEPLAKVVRDNLAQAAAFADLTLEPALHARLAEATERELLARRELVEQRASRGMGRDGHGDLRLDHVHVLGDRVEDVVAIDCIEFRDDLRRGDPVGDVAFLVMELEHEGRPDLAKAFFDAWSAARSDPEGALLLPLHVGYRHVVRGKVRSIESREAEVPPQARWSAAERARSHFIAALVTLEEPSRRPALVLACGLPGSGKSTVARALASAAGFARISSDETRKALAAWISAAPTWSGGLDGGLYSREWTDRTYRACREQAETLLRQGRRVIVDASFHEAARRAAFLDLARTLRVPAIVLECVVPDDEARRRLLARTGDASDADAAVRDAMAERWEAPHEDERGAWRRLDATGAPEAVAARALDLLRERGLVASSGT